MKVEIKSEQITDIRSRKILYTLYLKRIIDIFISSVSLIVLTPVFLIVTMLIINDSGFPVIYKQKRVGKNAKEFNVIKFRTMVVDADIIGPTSTVVGDNRITNIGKVLRQTSLDELPQLINVLKGEMSIVGFRPGVAENYTEEDLESIIFNLKPGITGYAQVNGRSNLTMEMKRELERRYSYEVSFLTDIKVILKTILVVFKKDGIT
jgi:lipopolysaccharide/colanic/teichoic acid biosynthesis glycosyltransferase